MIIEQRLNVAAPQSLVYEVSQDYSVRSQWDPFPKDYRRLGPIEKVQKGAKYEIKAWHGLKMIVEYVTAQAPERAASRMIQGPFFLKKFAGTWIFKKVDEENSKVHFRYNIEATWWAKPLQPLMLVYFSWESRRRIRGLRKYCESLHKSDKNLSH